MNTEHLISNGYRDIDSLLSELGGYPVRTALVKIYRRGLFEEDNDELNNIIHQIFSNAVSNEGVIGFRYGWDGVALFSIKEARLEDILIPILKKHNTQKIYSRSIIDRTIGPVFNTKHCLDNMEVQLNKINKWDLHLFDHYYENGIRVELHT